MSSVVERLDGQRDVHDGFAASPGTDVEPTCSIFRSCEPNAARI